MSDKLIKTIKVPLTIVEDDKELKNDKFEYVRKALWETVKIANHAVKIFNAIECELVDMDMAFTTFAYQECCKIREFVSSESVAGLTNNYIPQDIRKNKKQTIFICSLMAILLIAVIFAIGYILFAGNVIISLLFGIPIAIIYVLTTYSFSVKTVIKSS